VNELADFTVGDRVVRPSLGQIVNGTEGVHVEPRSMEVLVALAHQAPDLYPKRELIEAVWADAFVSDEVLTHAIWDLRRAFGDNASSPEFIQTIPKRGYRLIAPVEFPDEKQGAPETVVRPLWLAIAGMILIGLVLAAIFLRPAPTPSSSEKTRLVLVSGDGNSSLFSTFVLDLQRQLVGAHGLAVERNDCPPASKETVYCLEILLENRRDGVRVLSQIREAGSAEILWSPPVQPLTNLGAAATAARELTELVSAFFEVIGMPFYDDPDIRPWFGLNRHDMRAIRDFLLGVAYVYDNQSGGRNPIDPAAERDLYFVAPRVWRIPSLVTERAKEEVKLQTYLADLADLYDDATTFEKPMIKWAQAHADGDVRREIRELRNALKQSPSRPVLFMLAARLQANGNLEGAWTHYQDLIATEWPFPGLFTAAATCALQSGRFKEARTALESGRNHESPDPETYELSILFAIYDRERDTEQRLRTELNILRGQVDDYDFPLEAFAEVLAERAEADGRSRVAERLREFAG
jgi:DNA-binding winged helix-turn-helix (wHTH) protein